MELSSSPSFQRVTLLINERAGTFLHSNQEKMLASFREVCNEYQINADFVVVPPEEFGEALEKALQKDIDGVILGGGDGTISYSLHQLLEADKPIGVLPLGTMNMLARDLGISLQPTEALRTLFSGETQRIDVGWINDRPFLDRITLGFYPKVVKQWQKTRDSIWPVRALRFVQLFFQRLFLHSKTFARIESPTRPELACKTNMLLISNNPYQEDQLTVPVPLRSSMKGSVLAIYIAEHHSFWDYLKLFGRTLLGRWRFDEKLEVLQTQRCRIELPRHSSTKLLVSIDGDQFYVKQPLDFRIDPQALPVRVPASNS